MCIKHLDVHVMVVINANRQDIDFLGWTMVCIVYFYITSKFLSLERNIVSGFGGIDL